MTDTPGTRTETELDRLRKEAFAREAAALREAALAHFKEQTSAELTGLKTTLAAEIKTAVKEAMTDEAIKKALRQELTEQVLGAVSADIAKKIGDRIEKEIGPAETRVVEKVRKDLLASWTKAAKRALDDGFEEARADFDRDTSPGTILKSLVHSIIPGSEKTEERQGQVEETTNKAEASTATASNVEKSQIVPDKQQKSFFMRARRLGAVDLAAAAIVVFFFLLMLFVIRSVITSVRERSSLRRETPVPAMDTSPTPPKPNEPAGTTTDIRDKWIKVVTSTEGKFQSNNTNQQELRELIAKNPFNKQALCWFSDNAQKELEKLARHNPKDFLQKLEEAFTPCFTSEPQFRNLRLAIFSAQATVQSAFLEKKIDWNNWCAISNEVKPPSALTMDGLTGSSTQESMNLFLQCTGHGADLTIDANSSSAQYLYVTYIALQELQRQ